MVDEFYFRRRVPPLVFIRNFWMNKIKVMTVFGTRPEAIKKRTKIIPKVKKKAKPRSNYGKNQLPREPITIKNNYKKKQL